MRVLAGRRSIFFLWLLSYVVILVLLIALSGLVYFQARTALEEEINKAKFAVLREAENAINSRIADMERMSLQIAWNPRVESFMYLRSPLALEYHYNLTLLNRDFMVYKAAFNFIKEFFVFFGNSGLVLSSNTVCDPELYYTWYDRETAPTYREWMSFLHASHRGELVPYGASVAYVRSLPFGQSLPVNATLVIQLDSGWLKSTLGALSWNPLESVFILDDKNRVVESTGDAGLRRELQYDALGDEGVLTFRAGQATMLVSYIKSRVTGWKLVSILPHAAFMGRVTYLENLTVAGLLVCLVLGGLAAYLFSRRNYNFISEIARDMAVMAGISLAEGDNEYRLLKKALAASLEQKQRSEADRRQYNAALRRNFVLRLVRGRFDDAAAMQAAMEDFGIRPLSPHYAVCLLFPESGARPNGPDLVSLILCNGLEAIAGRRHLGLATEHDDMLIGVVNFAPMRALEWAEDFRTVLSEAKAFAETETGGPVTLAAGGIHTGIAALPTAYQEALDALEYKLILGPGALIEYEQIRKNRSTYQCSLETEQQLLNWVRSGNAERAAELLARVFESNFRGPDVSIQSVKCFIFDMFNLLNKAAAGLDEHEQHDLRELQAPLSAEAITGSLDTLWRTVSDLFGQTCRRIGRRKHDDGLALEIKDFVGRSFADVNLNIAMIADHFNLSQGYLSRLFRDHAGEGLLDYIGRMRIEQAKSLFRRPVRRLHDVALSVGYANVNSFIRTFKKFEGLTPGQYRDVSK